MHIDRHIDQGGDMRGMGGRGWLCDPCCLRVPNVGAIQKGYRALCTKRIPCTKLSGITQQSKKVETQYKRQEMQNRPMLLFGASKKMGRV